MKKKIALIAGGNSGESVVSLNSAKEVLNNIDKERYTVYIIIIEGLDWYYKSGKERITVNKNDFSIIDNGEKIVFDCAFIMIHGTPGEDGKLQGYFDMLQIPYTGCNRTTSALTFDKYFCNTIASKFGARIAKSCIKRKDDDISINDILSELSLPVFVKPNNGGSSLGTSRVNMKEELQEAIKLALEIDPEAIIEEFIGGTEMTCGVLISGEKCIVLPITEIVSKTEFFDYKAKYTDGMAEEITPARISEAATKECQDTSLLLYKKFNCKGVVRFDYILKENGELFFLEANTVPGQSANSIIPQQVRSYGMTMKEFYSLVIES